MCITLLFLIIMKVSHARHGKLNRTVKTPLVYSLSILDHQVLVRHICAGSAGHVSGFTCKSLYVTVEANVVSPDRSDKEFGGFTEWERERVKAGTYSGG